MSDPSSIPPDVLTRLQAGLSGAVPEIYANGFSIGLSNADVVLVLALSNRPIQTVHMSYTLAKTLHLKLADVVRKFEAGVGRDMLTTDDIEKLKKREEE